MLALDGVYAEDDAGFLRFHQVGPPSNKEVKLVAGRIARRIEKLMSRRGLTPDGEQPVQPFLAELYGAAVAGRVLTGRRAGQQTVRIGDLENGHGSGDISTPRCANVQGVGLHANTSIPAHDRVRLERMCRYMCRPPIALERLKLLSDGRLLYKLKKCWRDGTSKIIFEPLEISMYFIKFMHSQNAEPNICDADTPNRKFVSRVVNFYNVITIHELQTIDRCFKLI